MPGSLLEDAMTPRPLNVWELDFSLDWPDAQWLSELSQLELPSRLAAAEPRVSWSLHHQFDPHYARKYATSSLLSSLISFPNGYTASVQFGFESLPSRSEHIGVGCLFGDRAGRTLVEVFDLSSGAVLATPPRQDGPAREMVCEGASAKIALLALRQIEALPDSLSPDQRALWQAIEADDEPLARRVWADMSETQRAEPAPWGSVAVEHALASRSERCSRWLLSEEPRIRPGWTRLASMAQAALKERFPDDTPSPSAARALSWVLRAGAPLSEPVLRQELEQGGAHISAVIKAVLTLKAAQALAEREELSEAAEGGLPIDPLRSAL